MQHTLDDRILALAALFQAAVLVQQVARRGQADPGAAAISLGSLFHLDAPDTAAIFTEAGQAGPDLATGLRALIARLESGGTGEALEVTRYAIALMHLERQLARRPQLLETLRLGLERIQKQATYFSPDHANVIAALGELYQSTLSTLHPRILVQGEPAHLADPGRAGQIRALLLAGIRATVLWRQLGGSRWQLLLGRRKILDAARRRLRQI
ncbi:MAG: high frequency lysogenization protein HflD [Gammaproteobacteria bacterium]